MKVRNAVLSISMVALLAGASFAQKVKTDYDHNANFSQYKTYSWEAVKTQNQLNIDRIKNAVNADLTAKGFTQVPSGGSICLVANEATQNQQTLNTFYNGFGGGWRWRGGFGGSTTTYVDNYKVGTLVLDVFDAQSKKLLWRGSASDTLSDKADKNIKNLNKGVQKMLKDFPSGISQELNGAKPGMSLRIERSKPAETRRSDWRNEMKMKTISTLVLSATLMVVNVRGFAQQTNQATPAPMQAAQETPEQLQQLVAPIALYPDALVAQILAASTYPAQVVEADRWMQQHPDLKAEALGQQVDQQQWDPSVKALTQFPSVLANLDKNITWTSGLGDAYTNQQQDVMNAVQVMRQRAEQSGNLKTSQQEMVSTQGSTIIIQPVNPEVVYVPEYDPWIVYGAPVVVYPGWYPFAGLYIGGPGLFFGDGFGVGYFGGFGWGWHNWGYDWRARHITYEHNVYISHSPTFVNRHGFDHRGGAGFDHSGSFGDHAGMNRGGAFGGGRDGINHGLDTHGGQVSHGFTQPHNNPGTRSSAFSGFDHGGVAHDYSARGQSSMGGGSHGGGSFHTGGMGGGGFHGGGGGHR